MITQFYIKSCDSAITAYLPSHVKATASFLLRLFVLPPQRLGSRMTESPRRGSTPIDKRDFDAHRPLLREVDYGRPSPTESRFSRTSATHDHGDGSDGLLNDVVEGIVERDRRKMEKEVRRVCSFAWGVISWSVVTPYHTSDIRLTRFDHPVLELGVLLRSPFTAPYSSHGSIIPNYASIPCPSPPRSPCTSPFRSSDIYVTATRPRRYHCYPHSFLEAVTYSRR